MKCFRGLRARRAGGRRGMTSLLAMLYLVLFSAMAIGFYAQTTVASQLSTGERRLHEAQLAAEAGLSFIKYHLSALDVPHLPRDQRLEEIYMQLAGRLDGTGNLAGGNVGYDATNYRLEIPEGSLRHDRCR